MTKDFSNAPAAAFVSTTANACPQKTEKPKTKNITVAFKESLLEYLKFASFASETNITAYLNSLVTQDMQNSNFNINLIRDALKPLKKIER